MNVAIVFSFVHVVIDLVKETHPHQALAIYDQRGEIDKDYQEDACTYVGPAQAHKPHNAASGRQSNDEAPGCHESIEKNRRIVRRGLHGSKVNEALVDIEEDCEQEKIPEDLASRISHNE